MITTVGTLLAVTLLYGCSGCRLRKHCSALVKATRAWSAATLLRYVQPLNLCCSHTSCFCPCSLFVSLQTNTQGRTTVHTTGQMQAEKHRSLLLNAVIQRPVAIPGRSMAVGKATWRTKAQTTGTGSYHFRDCSHHGKLQAEKHRSTSIPMSRALPVQTVAQPQS